ncbi:MAG: penicillin-binding protein 2 [Anaerocolumna sp.]
MRNAVRDKKVKKFTNKMQAKLLLVFCIILITMVGLIARLVHINRTVGERYAKRVLSQQTYTSTVIPFQRGSILDRKGTVLAASEKVYNVILDVQNLLEDEENLSPTIKALTECYDSITKENIMDLVKTKPESRYVILKKDINYEAMMTFKDKEEKNSNIQGVWFEEDYVRTYPYKTLGSSVIGFTSSGNVGNWGIEQYYNNQLNGINGIEYGYIDSELKLEQTTKPAINGNTIISTIDANVQGIVQEHIKTYNAEFKTENIGVLVMNPNNGEILAMASNEEYDLNNPADLTPFYTKKEINKMSEKERLDALNAIWRNYAISDTYEPGSTFKPFTVSAGLEENIIHPGDTYVCDGGEEVGGYWIKCTHQHGTVTLTQALILSCNDALMQIGAKEGKKIFYDYQDFFGFGHKTGIDLPGEADGILNKGLSTTDIATNSFGQNFTTTMVQMAAGFSSLVNGGYYYEPHLVKQILNPGGAILENKDKILVKETISRETSDFIKNAMYLTVEEGTAKGAQVPGYKVGGKTGTAQKLPRAANTYLVSFLGCVPSDNPEIVIYVVIDNPQNVVGSVSSPIATKFAGEILTDILPFLEIYPAEATDGDDLTTSIPVLPSTDTKIDTEDNGSGNSTGEIGSEEEENPDTGESDDINFIPESLDEGTQTVDDKSN